MKQEGGAETGGRCTIDESLFRMFVDASTKRFRDPWLRVSLVRLTRCGGDVEKSALGRHTSHKPLV